MAIATRNQEEMDSHRQDSKTQPAAEMAGPSSRLMSCPMYPVLPTPVPPLSRSENIHAQEMMVSRSSGSFSSTTPSNPTASHPASTRLVYLLHQDSSPVFPAMSSLFGSPESSTSLPCYSNRSSSIASSGSSYSSPRSHYTTAFSVVHNFTSPPDNSTGHTTISSSSQNQNPDHSVSAEDGLSTGGSFVLLQTPHPAQRSLPAPGGTSTHLSQTFRDRHPLYDFFHANLKERARTISSGLEKLSQSVLIIIQSYLSDKDLQRLRSCNYNLYKTINIQLAQDYTFNRIRDLILREQNVSHGRADTNPLGQWGCFLCYRLLGPEHFDRNTQPKYAKITTESSSLHGVAGTYTFTPVNNISPIYVSSAGPSPPASTSINLFRDPFQKGQMNYIVNCPVSRQPSHRERSSPALSGYEVNTQQEPIATTWADDQLGPSPRLVTNNPRCGDIISLRRFCITCGVDSGLYPPGLRACITTRTGSEWWVCRCKIIWDREAVSKCRECGLNAPYQTGILGDEEWTPDVNVKDEEV